MLQKMAQRSCWARRPRDSCADAGILPHRVHCKTDFQWSLGSPLLSWPLQPIRFMQVC